MDLEVIPVPTLPDDVRLFHQGFSVRGNYHGLSAGQWVSVGVSNTEVSGCIITGCSCHIVPVASEGLVVFFLPESRLWLCSRLEILLQAMSFDLLSAEVVSLKLVFILDAFHQCSEDGSHTGSSLPSWIRLLDAGCSLLLDRLYLASLFILLDSLLLCPFRLFGETRPPSCDCPLRVWNASEC